MENATKALLIAAAVLVAILVISLGLVIYQQAAETVESINMSDQQVTANNEKFVRYNGANKKGTEVNAMLKTVLQANLDAAASNELAKQVEVTGDVTLATNATSLPAAQADPSALYTITVVYGGQGGLVSEIQVDAQ